MLDTMQTKSLELVAYTQVTVNDLIRRTRERLAAEDGQTAAEYIGIILVIVAVIAAVVASGIAKTITDGITNAIGDVKGPKGD